MSNVLNVTVQIVLWFSLVNFPSTFSFFFFIILFPCRISSCNIHTMLWSEIIFWKLRWNDVFEDLMKSFLKLRWNGFCPWRFDEISFLFKLWSELNRSELYRSFSMAFVLICHVTMQVVQVAQMSRLDANSLKELLPTEETFPSWIKFCEFEKVKVYLHRCWVLA